MKIGTVVVTPVVPRMNQVLVDGRKIATTFWSS